MLFHGANGPLQSLILPLLGTIIRVTYVYAYTEVRSAEETDHYH